MNLGLVAIVALFLVGVIFVTCRPAENGIHVAVAGNFTEPAKEIAKRFKEEFGYNIVLSFGSTGKHYAQIRNGAPFDVFLAADTERPMLLEDEGLAVKDSRYTYAIGKLVLWSPNPGYVDPDGEVLHRMEYRYLAIANPKLAPYGKAAEEVLQALRLWTRAEKRLVQGETVGHAYQYVRSGNAQLGFVAYSQVARPGIPIQGTLWEVPQEFYTQIAQQVVLLTDSPEARAFFEYLRSDEARDIIRSYGYGSP
jgi:molybdate transport system substrate-binding protein